MKGRERVSSSGSATGKQPGGKRRKGLSLWMQRNEPEELEERHQARTAHTKPQVKAQAQQRASRFVLWRGLPGLGGPFPDSEVVWRLLLQ